MSDNKTYYYIKLKDNYFENDNIKILEAQENGYIYSLIILKLYLKSAKYDGRLMMTDRIPYDPKKIDVLAKVLNHDIAHIKDALSHGLELDLITIQSSGEIWMTDIQNFIGHSSTEADRKREYRKKLDTGQMSGQISDKSPPELELKKEIKKESKINKAKNTFSPPTIEEVKNYCLERKNNVNPDKWHDFYTCKGWMVGKNKMKDWKAAVRTWEGNVKNQTGKQEQIGPSDEEIAKVMGFV